MNTQIPEKAIAGVKFTKVTIESDGTKDGTKILVNGKAVENLRSLTFNWWESCYSPISFEYSVADAKVNPGELSSYTTYRLRCPLPVGTYANEKAVASTETPESIFETFVCPADPALNAPKPANLYAQLR